MATTTAKHTPGPWVVWSVENDDSTRWSVCRHVGDLCSDDHACIASVKGATVDRSKADARLIAAAPELLELLRAYVELRAHFIVVERARALLARIDGE